MIYWDGRSEIPTSAGAERPGLGPLAKELIGRRRRRVVPGPRFLVSLGNARIGDESCVGTRAVNLGEMHENLAGLGLLIPDGFATSADAFEIFLDSRVPASAAKDVPAGLFWRNPFVPGSGTLRAAIRRILRDPDADPGIAERCRLVQSLVRATPIPPEVRDALRTGYRNLRNHHGQDREVAVRCSPVDDDGTSPFFGAVDEYQVGLYGIDQVMDAWRDRCSRAFSEQRIRAAIRGGTPLPGRGFGILILTVGRSDVALSGFVRTRDPVTWSRDSLHITASEGLGSAVPPGPSAQDAMVLPREGVRRGPSLMDVHPARGGPLLTANDVVRLASVALEVEEEYGGPVQMEWVQDSYTGDFMVLQVNPLGPGPASVVGEISLAPALERW